MEKYGVVDIGSNTVRLEVYDVNDQYIQLFFKKKEFLWLANYNEIVLEKELRDVGT